MNIYLTSYGLDNRYKDYMNSYEDIINVSKNKNVAIIPNAKLISQDRTNSSIAQEELIKNDIKCKIIDLDKDNLKLLVNIKNYIMEVIELPSNTNDKKFVYGQNKFRNCGKLKLTK